MEKMILPSTANNSVKVDLPFQTVRIYMYVLLGSLACLNMFVCLFVLNLDIRPPNELLEPTYSVECFAKLL